MDVAAAVCAMVYPERFTRLGNLDLRSPWLILVYFTTVTTAAGRDVLLAIGWLLLLAAVLHNTGGCVLGYGASRLLGLSRTDARTVALEAGLQNGGLASGIAGGMGKLGTVGLAAAIFSPCERLGLDPRELLAEATAAAAVGRSRM